MFWIKHFFLVCILKFTVAVITQDLNGANWYVSDEETEYTNLLANVPGGIYTDLMRNGVLDDIFYGYNDETAKWVPRKNWTYYRNFTVDPTNSLLFQENINIVFKGVDTFASIYLNEKEIGKTTNMFLQYIFDIKGILKEGNNTLTVKFQSPIEVADNLATEQSKDYIIPPLCPPRAYNGECHVNMIRKMQASYAWDWGPSFPSVGIWKDVTLEGYNETIIRYVVADIQEGSDDLDPTWNVTLDTYFANNSRGIIDGILQINMNLDFVNRTYVRSIRKNFNEKDSGEILDSFTFEISKGYVKSWWPNGYGEQCLYTLTLTFWDSNYTETSEKQIKIGFRSVELVQNPIDKGLTFYFKVNRVPIFMKGSNEIPINILPELGQNRSTIRYLFESARDVHMNTLRVWGGGVYESDYFYEVADELGIMIWQDFMFACALYPVNEEFLSNVVEEVRQQVKRLKSHPSVVIFSGNNENEGVIAYDWYGIRNNITTYKKDYVTLYHDTIEPEFTKVTKNKTVFITSSPTNGIQSVADAYISEDPGSSYYGDVHFYNYVFNPLDPQIYPIPRFASEYGYQSLPSLEALKTASNDSKDFSIYSDFMEHRQHHPGGILELIFLMGTNLNVSDINNHTETLVLYAQILQAMAVKIETERYRSRKSIIDDAGKGYTMGALYWQLNDVWVAPTWSGIDFTGRWKMLHYFAKDFFAPIIVTGEITDERDLNIYTVSDLTSPIENVTVCIRVFNWTSFEAVSTENITTTLDSLESQLVKSFNIDDYLSSKNCGTINVAKSNCFILLSSYKNNVLITPENFVLPNRIKDSNISKASVQILSVNQTNHENEFAIELKSDQIALFVWLDSHDIFGRFSENGFILINERTVVNFTSNNTVSVDQLKAELTVSHLTSHLNFV